MAERLMRPKRPSYADVWVPCSGAPTLAAHFPEADDEDTREGIAIHEIVKLISQGVVASPDEMVDRQTSNGVYITPDMAEVADYYIGQLGNIWDWNIEQTFERTAGGTPGTPDAWKLSPDGTELFVRDLKTGWGIIEPKMRWQLIDYADAILQTLPQSPQAIHLIIDQPRPSHPRGRTRWWNLTLEEFDWYREELYAAANRCDAPDPQVTTGRHCHHCPAMRACPAGREAALKSVQVSSQTMLEHYTGEELSVELELLDEAIRTLTDRRKAIDVVAIEKLRGGELVPGWSLETAFGRDQWKSEVNLKAVGKMYGVELFTEKPITPLQAKKKGVVVDGLYTTPETGHKLVRFDKEAHAQEVFGS